MSEAPEDTADLDREAPVALHWLDVPSDPQGGVVYPGSTRHFETLRNAVAAWAALPSQQRITAWATDDAEMYFKAEQLERLHQRAEMG